MFGFRAFSTLFFLSCDMLAEGFAQQLHSDCDCRPCILTGYSVQGLQQINEGGQLDQVSGTGFELTLSQWI